MEEGSFQIPVLIDTRLESYATFFNHPWSKEMLELVDGTKLDPPVYELCVSLRAAANTHVMPSLLATVLQSFWDGVAKHDGFSHSFVRKVAEEIPHRLRHRLSNQSRKELHNEIMALGRQLNDLADKAGGKVVEPPKVWDALINSNHELHWGIWGAQRLCFMALVYAYEHFFKQCVSIKRDDPGYHVKEYKQLIGDVEKEFGKEISEGCLDNEFMEVTRLVRNAIAHNGGRETKKLKTFQGADGKGHGFAVERGFLQVMAPHNVKLIEVIEQNVFVFTQKVLPLLK
jgi:hypothetical protein